MEYKQDEENDENDDERIDYPQRNHVPAPLPLVRQNASAPVAHLEDNDFITLSDTEYITISLPAAVSRGVDDMQLLAGYLVQYLLRT